MACCFACQAFVRLGRLQREPLQERQRLHVDDHVWEVIYNELKVTLESTDKFHPSANASPLPIQSTPNHHPTSDLESLKKTTTDASTQTPTQPTRKTPTTGGILRLTSTRVLSHHSPQPISNNQQPHQTTLPNLLNRYQPSPPHLETNKRPMLLSSNNLPHPHQNQFLQHKNLSFPRNPYSTIEDLTANSTLNRHRSKLGIRQANAQFNKVRTRTYLPHSHCPNF